MNTDPIPITERYNPKSINIDILKAESILDVLYECEKEIFGGYNNSRGVYDKNFIDKCVLFSGRIQRKIQKKGKVNLLLVGAGTSGRICRLMAKTLSPVVGKKIIITPVIAGGIKALVRAEPNTEDKIDKGVIDYLTYTADLDRPDCFVIGVSCGLSANYVKGALDEANKYSAGNTAIIGFNPLDLAAVELGEGILVLNPIIGPEPIVGSVRMKGGTATMILIYTLLLSALNKTDRQIRKAIINMLNDCREILSKTAGYNAFISKLINAGNLTLRSGGSIYLLGSSGYGTLCIYDAAECPPTFGARLNQVNGFTQRGILDLVYYSGETGEKMAKEIDLNVFIKSSLSGLTADDMVVTICNAGEEIPEFIPVFNLPLKRLYSLHVASTGKYQMLGGVHSGLTIRENWQDSFQKLLFIRSMLVCISTGSFVLSGKVYQNKMIDLRITNKKLFMRAIRIINHITLKEAADIKISLLRCIYEGEIPVKNNLEDHISLSATKENIVPLTILSLVYPRKSISELKLMLKKEPIVRKLILKEMSGLRKL